MVFDANLSPTTKATSAHYCVLRLKPTRIGRTIKRSTQIEDQTPVIESRAPCRCRGSCVNRLSLKGPLAQGLYNLRIQETAIGSPRGCNGPGGHCGTARSRMGLRERLFRRLKQLAKLRWKPGQSPLREPPMTRSRGLLLSGVMAAPRSHSVRNRRPSRYCALFQNRQCVPKRGKSLPEMLRVVAPRKTRPAD